MDTIPLTKRILAFSICSFTLFLTGCWDRIEINDIAIVVATGLDKTGDDKIELTVQLVNPKALGGGQGSGGGQSGGKLTTVLKVSGKTIFDARSKLQEKITRPCEQSDFLLWNYETRFF